jgi:alpha-1,3-rhamnosyl/mannosyltransferase
MASGCPVVAAAATSLPETVGSAGLFAGPHDLNGWRVAVESVLEDEVLRKQLIEAGLDRARDFSWEATAAATSAVYHKVLN